MNAFAIKITAIALMVVSHVGIFFFPQYPLLRIVGMIAFPLFAWLIANGAHHTRHVGHYLRRLFVFALISQVPFSLANFSIGNHVWYLNVFFTLFLGLLAIILVRSKPVLGGVATVFLATIAEYLNTDYGAAGVLAIVAAYIFFNRFSLLFVSYAVIFVALPYCIAFINAISNVFISYAGSGIPNDLIRLVSLIPIFLYDGTEGPKAKYLFYIFYPAHYLGIFIILRFLSS